jgi:transposase
MDKKVIQKSSRYFSESEKRQVIEEYLSSACSKEEIWRKYTGKSDHGRLLAWMRDLGYRNKSQLDSTAKTSRFASMSKAKSRGKQGDQNFEILQLQKRIFELEKQLKEAELKAIAFSTMVDIAEDEFKIPIRKKFNTKP